MIGASFLAIHVSAAITCYLFFIACVISCLCIAHGRSINPLFATSFCEAGLFFAAETLATGAFWAFQAWGKPWVWEPRLTGMFLMTLFFVSWRIAVAILGNEAVANKKLTASLIILGLPAIFFTHAAVRLFGGIHPDKMPASISWQAWMIILAALIHLGMGIAFAIVRYKKMAGRMERSASKVT